MNSIRQVWLVAGYNFRTWRKKPRILVTFALAFILCYLLSAKAIDFALDQNTTMQAFEAFVWTFGDSNSILLSSLLLILLFADMPFLNASSPYYLSRMKRATWLWGQILYVMLTTFIYMAFIFVATTLICMKYSFIGNMWSETAALLGYTGAGAQIAIPALVKTLEMSTPYAAAGTIFFLMLLYTLFIALVMLVFNLWKGTFAGIASVLGVSLYGFLLNPQLFQQIFGIEQAQIYRANLWAAWASPLQHATYHMHNFGYDLLPRLWMTYVIFLGLIVICFILAWLGIKRYNFNFRGTEL